MPQALTLSGHDVSLQPPPPGRLMAQGSDSEPRPSCLFRHNLAPTLHSVRPILITPTWVSGLIRSQCSEFPVRFVPGPILFLPNWFPGLCDSRPINLLVPSASGPIRPQSYTKPTLQGSNPNVFPDPVPSRIWFWSNRFPLCVTYWVPILTCFRIQSLVVYGSGPIGSILV